MKATKRLLKIEDEYRVQGSYKLPGRSGGFVLIDGEISFNDRGEDDHFLTQEAAGEAAKDLLNQAAIELIYDDDDLLYGGVVQVAVYKFDAVEDREFEVARVKL